MRQRRMGFRRDQGRPSSQSARSSGRKFGVERLEERALLAGVTEYPIPTPTSQPFGIVSGTDGNLWFTEQAANKIGKSTPSGVISEFPVTTTSALPTEIANGPTGTNKLWFTENGVGKIAEIDTTTNAITEFPIPAGTGMNPGTPAPFGITTGPDGNIWFTDANPNNEQIGEYNIGTGTFTEFPLPLPTGDGLTEITNGSDGNLWFVESTGNRIGKINPGTGQITEFVIPTLNSMPFGITTGPDGNLWFTEQAGNKIGQLNPTSGLFTEFPLPTASSVPRGITAGSDGNIWFTEQGTGRIGRLTVASQGITEFGIPTANSGPNGITTGPDKALWFTEQSVDQIGRLDPSQIISGTGTTVTPSASVAFTGVVASFTTSLLNAQASDFSATIDWGDGTTSPATAIVPASTGVGFDVAGMHTYSAAGTFTITVAITDTVGDMGSATSTAMVSSTPPPPINGPVPMGIGVERFGVHRQPTQIVVFFNSALDPTPADNALNYTVIALGPTNTLDTPNQIAAGHANNQYLHVLTAVYNPNNFSVTLTLYEHPNFRDLMELIVNGQPPHDTANGLTPSGLTSPTGVFLNGNTITGTDFVTFFRGVVLPPPATPAHTVHHPRPVVHVHKFAHHHR